jgi:hypothetical protein
MQLNFLESHIIDPSSEAAHQWSVYVVIVLVFFPVNEVEISCNEPGACAVQSIVSKLLQEMNLGFITLRPIDIGQPLVGSRG